MVELQTAKHGKEGRQIPTLTPNPRVHRKLTLPYHGPNKETNLHLQCNASQTVLPTGCPNKLCLLHSPIQWDKPLGMSLQGHGEGWVRREGKKYKNVETPRLGCSLSSTLGSGYIPVQQLPGSQGCVIRTQWEVAKKLRNGKRLFPPGLRVPGRHHFTLSLSRATWYLIG